MITKDSYFYFVELSNQLIGYFKLNLDNQFRTLEIERIYLISSWQSKGYENKILNEVVKKARNYRLDYIDLEVWEENKRSIKFYQNFDFKKYDAYLFKLENELQNDWLMKFDIKRMISSI